MGTEKRDRGHVRPVCARSMRKGKKKKDISRRANNTGHLARWPLQPYSYYSPAPKTLLRRVIRREILLSLSLWSTLCGLGQLRREMSHTCRLPTSRCVWAESLLRRVREVEESVRVVVLSVDFEDRLGERRHAPVVDYEEDGLRRRQSQSVAKQTKRRLVNEKIPRKIRRKYRTTVMSWDMLSSCGTRNLLLCRWGSDSSWSNRSTITCGGDSK